MLNLHQWFADRSLLHAVLPTSESLTSDCGLGISVRVEHNLLIQCLSDYHTRTSRSLLWQRKLVKNLMPSGCGGFCLEHRCRWGLWALTGFTARSPERVQGEELLVSTSPCTHPPRLGHLLHLVAVNPCIMVSVCFSLMAGEVEYLFIHCY